MTTLLPVARHYVLSWFVIDFLAVLPIDAIARAATADGSGESSEYAARARALLFPRRPRARLAAAL